MKAGEILASGEGEPTDEVKKFMTEKYKFNHEKMVNIFNN